MLAAESAGTMTFPILTALVLLPAVGSLLVALMPRSRPDLPKIGALVSSVATLGLAIWLLTGFFRAVGLQLQKLIALPDSRETGKRLELTAPQPIEVPPLPTGPAPEPSETNEVIEAARERSRDE